MHTDSIYFACEKIKTLKKTFWKISILNSNIILMKYEIRLVISWRGKGWKAKILRPHKTL